MDALFGLPRKKSAGFSYRKPLHGHIYFCDQSLVDEYVSDYVMGKGLVKVCLRYYVDPHVSEPHISDL